MIRTTVLPLLTHFRIRLKATLTSPSALTIVLVFGGATLFFWPVGWPKTTAGSEIFLPTDGGPGQWLLWIMWLYMWPMVPVVSCRGRAGGGGACNPLATMGTPTLPIGYGARAVAEGALVLLFAAVVHITGMALISGAVSTKTLASTVTGAAVLFPTALAWALGASSINVYMLRPLLAALVMTGAASLGLTRSLMTVAPISIVLGWLLVRFVAIEEPDLRRRLRRSRQEDRSRPARKPLEQLRRDTWAAPLSVWAPWIGATVLTYFAALYFDLHGSSWPWLFFAAFEVYLVVALQALLRPLGSNLAMESLMGKHGVQRGDFLRAWAVLPVTPVVVLRRVWLHGLFFGGIVWGVPIFMLALRTWLSTGTIGLLASDGDNLAELVLPTVVFVPMIAGFLVAVCAGRKPETIVSGITLLLGVHTVLLLRVLLESLFGRDSVQAVAGVSVYIVILFIAAAGPPLRLLRAGGAA